MNQKERELRLVVRIGDAVVEDRRVDSTTRRIAFGRGTRCQLLVASADAPARWALFARRRGRWVITPAPGMRVHGPLELHGEADHGSLELGEITVAYALVEALPRATRPALPASLRLRLRDRVDPYMGAVVLFSLIAHTGAIGWIASRDTRLPPPEPEEAGVLAHPLLPLRPPTPVHLAPAPAGILAAPAAPVPAKPPASTVPHAVPAGPAAAPTLASAEDARGVLALVGHAGKRPGRFDDVTGKTASGEDLASGVHRVGDAGIRVADARAPSALTPGDTIGAGRDLHASGPADVLGATHPPRGHEDAIGHVDLPRPPADPGSDRPADGVYARIRASYFGRVQKCYEAVLKRDASLRGRIDVSLTIGERGQVTAVRALGFDDSLDACIEADARRWHFDAGEAATFEFPFSFQPSDSSRDH